MAVPIDLTHLAVDHGCHLSPNAGHAPYLHTRPSPPPVLIHGSGPDSSQTHLVPSGPDVWSFHSVSKWLRRRPRTRHLGDALKGPTAFALDENSSADQDERRNDQHGLRNQVQIVTKDGREKPQAEAAGQSCFELRESQAAGVGGDASR